MLKSRNNLIQSFSYLQQKYENRSLCRNKSWIKSRLKKWRIEPGLLKDQNGCYNNFLSKMLLNEVYLSKNNAYLNIFKEGRYVNNFHVCLRRIKKYPHLERCFAFRDKHIFKQTYFI